MLLQPAVGLSAQAYSSSQAKFLSSAIAKVKLCTLFCSHNQLGKKHHPEWFVGNKIKKNLEKKPFFM